MHDLTPLPSLNVEGGTSKGYAPRGRSQRNEEFRP